MAQGPGKPKTTLADDSGVSLGTSPADGAVALQVSNDERLIELLTENNQLLRQLIDITREGLHPRGPIRDVDL